MQNAITPEQLEALGLERITAYRPTDIAKKSRAAQRKKAQRERDQIAGLERVELKVTPQVASVIRKIAAGESATGHTPENSDFGSTKRVSCVCTHVTGHTFDSAPGVDEWIAELLNQAEDQASEMQARLLLLKWWRRVLRWLARVLP